jgi:hypothetical protein
MQKRAAKLDIIFEKTMSYFKKNHFFCSKTVQRYLFWRYVPNILRENCKITYAIFVGINTSVKEYL